MTDNDAIEARRAYQREYYRTHKEQHKACMSRYWKRKALGDDASPKRSRGKPAKRYDSDLLSTALKLIVGLYNEAESPETKSALWETIRLVGDIIREAV